MIEANWADLWRRLDRPGELPAPGPLLSGLAAAALIEAEPIPVSGADHRMGEQSGGGDQPGAGSGRCRWPTGCIPGSRRRSGPPAGPGMREAADAELAAFWEAVSDGRGSGRAGRTAAWWCGRGWRRPRTCCAAATGTPPASCSSRPSCGTGRRGRCRRCCRRCGGSPPPPARRRMSACWPACSRAWIRARRSGCCAAPRTPPPAPGTTGSRPVSPGDLVNLLRDAGRLAEALAVAGQKPEYTRRAGLGPWTQLADQARRLQVLGRMGEHERVLAETEPAARRDGCPARPPRPQRGRQPVERPRGHPRHRPVRRRWRPGTGSGAWT